MRLGLYGGTFDPIHLGHVLPVRAALEALDLDRILVFPTAQPPHKLDREPIPAPIRFAMTELAFLEDRQISVSPYETEKRGPAYTVDTVRWAAARHPDAELHLLIGEDSVESFATWKRWREIAERVVLVALGRPGHGSGERRPATERTPAFLRDVGARVCWLESVQVDVSSTEIRAMLARGEDPGPERVPEAVGAYLRKYDDYRTPATPTRC